MDPLGCRIGNRLVFGAAAGQLQRYFLPRDWNNKHDIGYFTTPLELLLQVEHSGEGVMQLLMQWSY